MKVNDILGGSRKRITRGSRHPRLKGVELLKINESGAMPGVGAIHISEIEPTLRKLEQDIGLDLRNNVLGSVGKKEFSGDIDVAVKIPEDKIPELVAKVGKSSIVDEVYKSILVVISRVEIQGYDESKQTDRPRTGYVQVDFMVDEDPDWLKTFYHSPSDKESKYKGAHRNIGLGALTQFINPVPSEEKTPDGRPVSVERYMFSSKLGLVRVRRDIKKRKDGKGYTKSFANTVIDGPWKDADSIAKELGLGTAADINSFETIFNAVKANYGEEMLRKWGQVLARDKSIEKLGGVPEEMEPYL